MGCCTSDPGGSVLPIYTAGGASKNHTRISLVGSNKEDRDTMRKVVHLAFSFSCEKTCRSHPDILLLHRMELTLGDTDVVSVQWFHACPLGCPPFPHKKHGCRQAAQKPNAQEQVTPPVDKPSQPIWQVPVGLTNGVPMVEMQCDTASLRPPARIPTPLSTNPTLFSRIAGAVPGQISEHNRSVSESLPGTTIAGESLSPMMKQKKTRTLSDEKEYKR